MYIYRWLYNTPVRPWYGSWPPKVYRIINVGIMRNQWKSHSLTYIMTIVVLIGILFIILPHYYPNVVTNIAGQLAKDVGIAFVVAGVLGVSVDQFLRRQLAEDAFKASIGYLLPDELKGEMEWIYSTHILCVEHNQTCELRKIDDDTCVIHVYILRKFRNISSSNESLPIVGYADEWFQSGGESRIISFGYTKLDTQNEITERIKKEGCVIGGQEPRVSLAPSEEITVWFESEEIKHSNDEQYWVFGCPTLNPTVIVRAFEGTSIIVNFGYRSSAEQLGVGTHRLSGTLLAGQGIKIRWWDRSKLEQWLNT